MCRPLGGKKSQNELRAGHARGTWGRKRSKECAFVSRTTKSWFQLIPDVPSHPQFVRPARQDWHTFYETDDKYVKRGVLAGRFYDTKGKPTRELAKFHKCAREGEREKEREAAEKKL